MDKEVTLERFMTIVDAYGASAERWPASERRGALALLSASSEARTRLAEAKALDGLLAVAPAGAPSAQLIERLMAARPRRTAWLPSSTGISETEPNATPSMIDAASAPVGNAGEP